MTIQNVENLTIQHHIHAEQKDFNYLTCNTKNLSEILTRLNRSLDQDEEVTFDVQLLKKYPLYQGIFVYFGFQIKDIQLSQRYAKITLIKNQVIPSTMMPKQYSMFIKLPRTGLNGRRIFVLKFRTMEPYSEYIQDYVIQKNGLNEDGTIKNDFRITKMGSFMRRYWLDELPMILNFFRGDLKLIGFRPLSDAMLKKYPQEYVVQRHKYKPGLIPPYYIDKPNSFEGLIESERKYIKAYEEKKIIADFIYFFKFINALLFKGVRSS